MQVAPTITELHRLMLIGSGCTQSGNHIAVLSEHYTLSQANSMDEAWELLNCDPLPDVILLDTNITSEDELAFCQRVRENSYFQDIPIVFLSNESDTSIQSDAFCAGAADFITKPLNYSALLSRVDRRIEQHHKTKRLKSLIYIDPLTHLPNATKFHEVLIQEWSRCVRYAQHLSLILVRTEILHIDSEGLNSDDYYAIIPSIANKLSNIASRPGDLLALLNTNTFGLILSDCSSEGAALKSSQIMENLSSHGFKASHQSSAINVRGTVAYTVAAPADGSSSQELMTTTESLLNNATREQKGGVYQYDILLGK